ncbi:UDP-N-acetylglucosamine diphosphorylase [Entamoeba marina]
MNSDLLNSIHAANQSHLLKFIDQLSDTEKSTYLNSLATIDFSIISKLLNQPLQKSSSINPFKNIDTVNSPKHQEWRDKGLFLLSEGKGSVLMLCGGQGTRLGFDHPKGCYDLNLPSHKTLFQIQCERLQSLRRLAQHKYGGEAHIPLIIMTNISNDQEIREFFASRKYFGLPEQDVLFFAQGMLPAVDKDGKILMGSKNSICLSPNGNGGVYKGLNESGVLNEIEKRGVQYIVQTAVDNVLNKMADPTLIGYMEMNKYDCCAKVLPKTSPTEAVGVLVEKDGVPAVVEYSEISGEMANRITPDGSLAFNAAHICNNGYTVEMMKKAGELYLPFHIAHKKVPCINEDGIIIEPSEPNGYKFEMFIFDAFALAEKMGALEVLRDEEFSPLKNADNAKVDCPTTCRAMIYNQSKKWLEDVGAIIDESDSKHCEISYLISYDGEGLEKYKGKKIKLPYSIN